MAETPPSFLKKCTVWHTGTRKLTETLLTKEGRVRALEITLEHFESY